MAFLHISKLIGNKTAQQYGQSEHDVGISDQLQRNTPTCAPLPQREPILADSYGELTPSFR